MATVEEIKNLVSALKDVAQGVAPDMIDAIRFTEARDYVTGEEIREQVLIGATIQLYGPDLVTWCALNLDEQLELVRTIFDAEEHWCL